MMKRASILGLGLMGGSLCLALRRMGGWSVAAYARRPETRAAAETGGFADQVFSDPVEAVKGADMVVVCSPILAMEDLIRKIKPGLKPGALVTDVGSTKSQLAVRLPEILHNTSAAFIGSHPICGSEKTGIEASIPDLYRDALVVVTPRAGDSTEQVRTLENFWSSLGAHVFRMPPSEHDAALAMTSHLPHLAAVVLARTVGRDGPGIGAGRFCGSGFRDATRLADGSAEVWHDIAASNRDSILGELKAFSAKLGELIVHFEQNDFEAIADYLAQARLVRNRLLVEREDFLREQHDA